MGTGYKILIGCIGLMLLSVLYLTLDANKYSAQVRAIADDGKIGVNPTTERLDFGDLSAGSTGVRKVTLENSTGMAMWVKVVTFGEISELMDVREKSFTLKPDTSETIEFSVYMPASIVPDYMYTGRVLIFRVPLFRS